MMMIMIMMTMTMMIITMMMMKIMILTTMKIALVTFKAGSEKKAQTYIFLNQSNQSLIRPLSQAGGRWKILISCDKEIRFPWIRKSQLDHHCRSGSDS